MTHDNDNIDIDFEPAPPDKLYAHNRRQLSALLDGELSPDQARFMLRRLQHDGERAACWERWQVCGDILRGRGHALLPADFSKRVAAGIAAADGVPAAAPAPIPPSARPRRQRLLHWGGGALAASVALVALFMARQLPDPHAPALAEAGSASRSAPALVQAAPPVILADAGDATAAAPDAVPEPAQEDGSDGGLLAAAAPVVLAAAEVPRRAAARSSTRSQSQRVAARRAQAMSEAPLRAVATAQVPPPIAAVPQQVLPAAGDALPGLAGLPAVASGDGEGLFGALPDVATRPWPRAVLPGLSGRQPFAAGYGLPQAEAFAPFQPRLEPQRSVPAPVSPPPQAVEQGVGAGSGSGDAGPGSSD